jgi:large subunit ribosomal protein L18
VRIIRTLKKGDARGRRIRRHRRVRARVSGTQLRPRLAVFRSLSHIYAQIIDDTTGHTLVAASTLEPDLRQSAQGPKTERAKAVGKTIAERAKEKGIETVVFDRGGFLYHGRVKALADAAREAGLVF